VPGSSSDAVDGGGGSSGTARLGRGQHGHRDQRLVAWAGPGWRTGQVRGATLRNKVATAWCQGRRWQCRGCTRKIRQPDDKKIFFTGD
jgi:hypothetical protein